MKRKGTDEGSGSDPTGAGPVANAPAKSSNRKARLADVARVAGVGIATVDRVLNERGHVSQQTARKVIEAAKQLGLSRILPPLYQRGLRIEVVLVRRETPFIARLSAAFERVAATLDRSIIVQRSFVDEDRPTEVAQHILSTKSDALILYGQEQPVIVDAVATATSAGMPVVALVSDLPTSPRVAYVGIDHYSAGRTAAFFMSRMAPRDGPVIVMCHSFDYRAQAERVSGFRDGLADHGRSLSLAGIIQGRDQPADSEAMMRTRLATTPGGVVGIYNAGGANRAVEAAIGDTALDTKPVFIGHELTVHTARMLAGGVMTLAIDQNPELQARRAIDFLLRRAGYADGVDELGEVPFTIFGPENLPSVTDYAVDQGV